MALLAHEEAGDGRIVIDDEAVVAIKEFAARGKDGDFADAIGFSQRVVILAADDLQTPESQNQHDHDGRDGVLDDGEPDGGQLFFAIEHGWCNSRPRLAKNGPFFSAKW